MSFPGAVAGCQKANKKRQCVWGGGRFELLMGERERAGAYMCVKLFRNSAELFSVSVVLPDTKELSSSCRIKHQNKRFAHSY